MTTVMQTVREVLDALKWSYSVDEERKLIATRVNGNNGDWRCMAFCGAADQFFILNICPGRVPPARRAACAELLTRINYDHDNCCFEMDFKDGEVRVRSSSPVVEGAIQRAAVEHVLFSNCAAIDRFLPAIMAVIFGDRSPTAALEDKQQKKKKSKAPGAPRFQMN